MEPGDVCYTWVPHGNKYRPFICVDPDQDYFLFIQTKRPPAAEAAVPVSPREIVCLTHDSWIDISTLRKVVSAKDDVAKDPTVIQERIGAGVRDKIRRCVEEQTVMVRWQRRLVLEKLCGLDPESALHAVTD